MKKFMNVVKTITVIGVILLLAVLVRLPDSLGTFVPSDSTNHSNQRTNSVPKASLSSECWEAKNILLLRIEEAQNPNGVMGLYVAKAAFDEALRYADNVDSSYNCRGTLDSTMRQAVRSRERVISQIEYKKGQHTW